MKRLKVLKIKKNRRGGDYLEFEKISYNILISHSLSYLFNCIYIAEITTLALRTGIDDITRFFGS